MACYLYAGRKSLLFRISTKIDVFFVGDPNWLDFSTADPICLDFSVGMEFISLLCGWSKLTSFLNAGRKLQGGVP